GEVMVGLERGTGAHEVRLDFDLVADRRYQFSVYRTIQIGTDDVRAEFATRIDEHGELVVEQKFVNKNERPVSFRCSLFAPDRRRMMTQVLDQGRGADLQAYRLAKGAELVGKILWVRADEIDGPRTLNYRFKVQQ